jgi:hypothetical protein
MRSSLTGSDSATSALRASMAGGPDAPNVTSTLDRCVAQLDLPVGVEYNFAGFDIL